MVTITHPGSILDTINLRHNGKKIKLSEFSTIEQLNGGLFELNRTLSKLRSQLSDEDMDLIKQAIDRIKNYKGKHV